MIIINGTKHKERITDHMQVCSRCGRVMYFNHDCNGKWVKCPHCNHLQ